MVDIKEISVAQIDELKNQYGEIHCLSGETEDREELNLYFRKPARKDLSRFASEYNKDIMKAANNLVFGCLVYPDVETVRKLIDDKPGLISPLATELNKIVSGNIDFLSKKL